MTDDKKYQKEVLNVGQRPDPKHLPDMKEDSALSASEGQERQQSGTGAGSETPSEPGQDIQIDKAPDGLKQPEAKNKAGIATFEDFIVYAYKMKSRKVLLKQKTQELIAKDPFLSEEAKQRLSELSRKDAVLGVPRQLLLAARDITRYPQLRSAIHSFVRDILSKHPLFLQSIIREAIQDHGDAPIAVEVLEQLTRSNKSLIENESSLKMKDTDFDKLRLNAVYCMAVWLVEVKGRSFSSIIDALYDSLWEPKAHLVKHDSDRLRALTDIENPASVGLVCSEYRRKAREQRSAADAAIEEAVLLRDRIDKLEAEIEAGRNAAVQAEEERRTEKERLLNEIAELRTKAEAESTHLRDDLEHIRTRVLRRLKSDLPMLEDGLHALRRSAPKVHIMVDIAERVADALRKEIKNLEGG